MTGKQNPSDKKLHLYPPPPKGFDPFKATEKDSMPHSFGALVSEKFRVDCIAHWAFVRLQSGSHSALPADGLASGHTFELVHHVSTGGKQTGQ